MNDKTDQILLTEQEAITLLQPHMRSKSAEQWLRLDRLIEPSVPFYLLQGKPYYLELELLAFITRVLNPAARFIRINNHWHTDNRNMADVGERSDRRINLGAALSNAIERRDPKLADRRSNTAFELFSQPAI